MTNADVVRLVKAGMATDTIVLAIQNGKTSFDTSPDALIALSRTGVKKAVIDAMLTNASNSGAQHKSGNTAAPAQNLSDDFAKAALRALNAINGEPGVPSAEGGHISVPRATQQSIDDADAEGRTVENDAVISLLNKLFLLKLVTNQQRAIIMLNGYDPQSIAKASAEADADPYIRDNSMRLGACSSALDSILRQRNLAAVPNECSNLSLLTKAATPKG